MLVDGLDEMWGRTASKALPERNQEVTALLAEFKACSTTRDLEKGKQVHQKALECGHDSSVYVASALINMYSKCSSMVDAYQVFDNMKHTTVVAWNALIMGYAENGQGLTALEFFSKMKAVDFAPDSITFLAALKACTSFTASEGAVHKCRDKGKYIHNLVVENCYDSSIFVQNSLIGMYSKCGSMVEARQVYDNMMRRTVVSWNALILGYAEHGQSLVSLDLFKRMQTGEPPPDSVTFLAALKACINVTVKGRSECKGAGIALHNLAVENDCYSDIYVQSSLIDMYAKCGSIVDGRQVFDGMKHPTVVSWNSLLLGYAENGQGLSALDLFVRMKSVGPAPNFVTFLAVFKACASTVSKRGCVECSQMGKQLHNLALENYCVSEIYSQNTLIDMYSKCGSMVNARWVFDSIRHPTVVSWNALIMGYAENGQGPISWDVYMRMKSGGFAPDSVTFIAALKACISLAAIGFIECRERGKEVHDRALQTGCASDVFVQSTLINMYAKCGSMADARQVFDGLRNPDVVCWNALIMGYADNGQGVVSLHMLTRMRSEGPAPDFVTFAGALKACALLGALEFGRKIHTEIDSGKHFDMILVTCLVDFYAKCGSLMEAQIIFDLYDETRDISTWTALLTGYSCCGDHESVFGLFKRMQDAGCQPDGVTFLCILTCCCHAGLVDKGKECFDIMSTKCGIIPLVEHCTCMVDIFGRANKLHDAFALLVTMSCSPDDVTWTTVLGACRKWKNLEIGRLAFESVMSFNNMDVSGYVLMGQIYGSRGMLLEQKLVMGMREKLKPQRAGESSWTNMLGEVHTFLVLDR